MKEDEKTLKSFNISENCSIHLFPIPKRTPVIDSTTGVENLTANPISNVSSSSSYQTPIFFDPEISQHCREVRLWSVMLVFLSSMALFNNLSHALSTGN